MKTLAKKTLQGGVSGKCGSQIIIAHGLLGNSTNWMSVGRRLAAHDGVRGRLEEIHMLDMRNHGESPHFNAHTNATMASDIEHFVLQQQRQWQSRAGAEGDGGIVLIGHSMGGFAVMGSMLRRANETSLLLQSGVEELEQRCKRGDYYGWCDEQGNAAEMRAVNRAMGLPETQPLYDILYDCKGDNVARPPRVKAVVIVDITPSTALGTHRQHGQNSSETLDAMVAADLSRVHSFGDGNAELERVGVSNKAMRDFLLTNLRLDPRTKEATWRCNLPVLRADYNSIALGVSGWFLSASEKVSRDRGGELVAPLRCSLPTLFVFGQNSPYNTPEDRRLIPRFFSNAIEVEVEGAGHFVHYEKMQEFVNVVVPFLTEYL
ncbi:Alpha/beta hydrolase family, putative [Trypanosoma equiperdum]|uniref:AB hydrolase-1 domain-containing protein n=2 Tax=Trypanozoon TaxID=39700 RepID=Q386E3_TRYB2|nr:hypothetical protein, conserved [Trypanosoma brucei brucei TREU927]EAN79338.1 hypothetical protein, conserved [Trypanosoma brucei brucei TREU927]SCU68169.1 Alpha/beta hydrolase family, putative [Trypanosoma equiperdum]